MTICKKCDSKLVVKNGIVRTKQRYKCKDCGHNFVEGDNRKGRYLDKRRLALHLYLENMGFRAIGIFLGVSNVSVLRWIKEVGVEVSQYNWQQKRPDKVRVMEFDEMLYFVKKIMDLDCIGQSKVHYS